MLNSRDRLSRLGSYDTNHFEIVRIRVRVIRGGCDKCPREKDYRCAVVAAGTPRTKEMKSTAAGTALD